MEGTTICLLALVSLFAVGRSELVMDIFPEEVIPGITPSFTLRCTTADVETNVVSLQIKRTTQSSFRHMYETLATLNSSSINSSVVTGNQPGMTAHGMLSRVGINPEIEVLPYLEITWQNPSVNDLGTYVCDTMMIGEMGQAVPLSAFISVTTQDPISDRLLHLLHTLRDQVTSMTGQMGSLHAELARAKAGQQNQGTQTGNVEVEQETEERRRGGFGRGFGGFWRQ